MPKDNYALANARQKRARQRREDRLSRQRSSPDTVFKCLDKEDQEVVFEYCKMKYRDPSYHIEEMEQWFKDNRMTYKQAYAIAKKCGL